MPDNSIDDSIRRLREARERLTQRRDAASDSPTVRGQSEAFKADLELVALDREEQRLRREAAARGRSTDSRTAFGDAIDRLLADTDEDHSNTEKD